MSVGVTLLYRFAILYRIVRSQLDITTVRICFCVCVCTWRAETSRDHCVEAFEIGDVLMFVI